MTEPLTLDIVARIDGKCDSFEKEWLDGKQPRIEDYLGPAMEPERSALLKALLALDIHYRERAGQPVSADQYRERFPDQTENIEMVLGTRSRSSDEKEEDPFATASVGVSTSAGLRFHILRPHAKGGLGEVFVAHDEELHREVALKEIQNRHADDAESRARFMLEAEITGGLEHPGIVPVYGLGTYADGRPYYAMRFIRGDSLQDAIKRYHKVGSNRGSGRGEGDRVLEMRNLLGRFIDVCQAIQYAHDRGVVHRDLKPGNIMLGKYGETLVVDWGLAKPLGEQRTSVTARDEPVFQPTSNTGASATVAGTALGTPAFMSPEQAAGRLDLLGPASDVYSLGATLYALLTGKAPVDDRNLGVVLTKVQNGDFQPPRARNREVHPALEAVCLKAMALKPGDRYASPMALADDIEHWLGDEPVSAMPEPISAKAARWMRRHKPLVSGVAAACLMAMIALMAGAVWYAGYQAQEARKQARVEEKIRVGVDQARQTRAELHQTLRQSGGVHSLLDRPDRWQAQIQAARGDWQRAIDLADATIDPHWISQLRALDAELTRDQDECALALRLDKIRLDRAIVVDGKLGVGRAREEYQAAFAKAGLSPAAGRQKEVARLIQQSAIKEKLLAALDDWAPLEHVAANTELTSRILEVARLADPDPWRDRVRNATGWKDGHAIVRLAQETQRDKAFLARLSPQMLGLVAVLLPRGDVEEQWLRTAQRLHPADFWIALDLADSLGRRKNALEATGFFRVALAIRPDNAAVYHNLGVALKDGKELPAAIEAFNKALAINPRFASAWTHLGMIFGDQKNLPAAIEAYKQALAVDPNYGPAWNNLGVAHYDQKDLPAAMVAYQKAVAISPEYAGGWYNLGNCLRDLNDFPAALDAYKKAVAIDPTHAFAWSNLGKILCVKDPPAAMDALRKSLALDPQNALAWEVLGNCLRDRKDLPAARDAYEKALAIDPQNAGTWYNFGHFHQQQEDLPAAIEAYRKALTINPKLVLAWNNLGIALKTQNDLPAAIDAYRKCLAINPNFAKAWNNLGLALRAQKDLPAAVESHNKALAIDPTNPLSWSNLGQALFERKDLPAAIEAMKKAAALNPENADTWNNLGFALRSNKNLPAAIEAYKKALAIDAEHAYALRNLADAQRLLALEKRLLDVLQGDVTSAADLLTLAGFSRFYKERNRDAVSLYAKAFAAEPKVGPGHRYHAACCAALAAAGNGMDAGKLDAEEQTRLRQQAFEWLQADLGAFARFLEKNPVYAIRIMDELTLWRRDVDIASLRDEKEIAKLPAAERSALASFWQEVDRFAKRTRSSYTQTVFKGHLAEKKRLQSYPIKMAAGETYVIDLASPQFDAYLRLEDEEGKVVAENDDLSETNPMSRIVFTAPKDGGYRIVATSFQQRGGGDFTLTIREFIRKK